MENRKKTVLIIVIICLVIAAGVGIGFLAMYMFSGTEDVSEQFRQQPPSQTVQTSSTAVPNEQQPSSGEAQSGNHAAPLVNNPIDFAALHETNTDAYGWLYVPNTNIDYPLLCSSDQPDDFYLSHNLYKNYEFAGCIYSEKQNGRDMASRNTLIYGHNMLNGTMFRTLHYFEDEAFFNENDTFYIYTPGHILTYTIFAAYEYDDRHILNSFNNFQDDAVWAQYLEDAQNPKSMNVHTRSLDITTDDRIVTLSTCVGTNKGARYLVQGVLVNDQPTK